MPKYLLVLWQLDVVQVMDALMSRVPLGFWLCKYPVGYFHWMLFSKLMPLIKYWKYSIS